MSFFSSMFGSSKGEAAGGTAAVQSQDDKDGSKSSQREEGGATEHLAGADNELSANGNRCGDSGHAHSGSGHAHDNCRCSDETHDHTHSHAEVHGHAESSHGHGHADGHSHDNGDGHGHSHGHSHEDGSDHGHGHGHGHSHEHGGHGHSHAHDGYVSVPERIIHGLYPETRKLIASISVHRGDALCYLRRTFGAAIGLPEETTGLFFNNAELPARGNVASAGIREGDSLYVYDKTKMKLEPLTASVTEPKVKQDAPEIPAH